MTRRRVIDGHIYIWTRRGWRLVMNGCIRTRKGWRKMRPRRRSGKQSSGASTGQGAPITTTDTMEAAAIAEAERQPWCGKYAALRMMET